MSAILREYGRSIGKALGEIELLEVNSILVEDEAHDENYFTSQEYAEVTRNLDQDDDSENKIMDNEVYNGDEDRRDPILMGIPEDTLNQEGDHVLENDRVVKVQKGIARLFRPGAGHPAEGLPWRSTWGRNGEEPWHLIEDEVRWPELEQADRPIRPYDFLVTLFKGRSDRSPGQNLGTFLERDNPSWSQWFDEHMRDLAIRR